jgi:hypothetical protein
MRYCEPARPWDKVQVKCWKRTSARVDLVSSGGHDVLFPDRRVFPLRFLLRHYPIRSQTHGERKIFIERRPRLDVTERELGWHIQYDHVEEGHNFLASPGQHEEYDPERIRLDMLIRHRGVEILEQALNSIAATSEVAMRSPDDPPPALAHAVRQMIESRDQQLQAARSTIAALQLEITDLNAALAQQHSNLERIHVEKAAVETQLRDECRRREEAEDTARVQQNRIERLDAKEQESSAKLEWLQRARRDLEGRLDAVYASKTWRWTAPLRRLFELVTTTMPR